METMRLPESCKASRAKTTSDIDFVSEAGFCPRSSNAKTRRSSCSVASRKFSCQERKQESAETMQTVHMDDHRHSIIKSDMTCAGWTALHKERNCNVMSLVT
eukprot:6486258-Amphidinium_carterae.1